MKDKIVLVKKKMAKSDKIFVITMISLPLLHFLIFAIYININSFVMAFQNLNYETNQVKFVGLENFINFFEEFKYSDEWQKAIKNSLGYFPVTAVIMLPLSILSGYFLMRKVPLHSVYKVLFFMPSIISIVVLGIVFRNMFDMDGPVNFILMKVYNKDPNSIPAWLNSPTHTMNILYIYAVWAGIGYNVVILFGAMTRVPLEVVESARIDGIGLMREIFSIYIPIIWPTISTLIVFSAMTVFQQFIHPLVLTNGSGDSKTVPLIIIQKINFGNYYDGAALGIMLAIIGVPVVQFIKWLTNKIYDTVEV